MYGLVNKAVEDMISDQFGDAKWGAIKAKAGVDVEAFVSNQPYPDEITYALVGAATQVLQVSQDELLIRLGKHWVLKTAAENYGPMMKSGGKNLREFLINLPNFHTRVAMLYPQLKPPLFTYSNLTNTSLMLHYHTHRPGLTMFVVGLVQGLGQYYNTPVQCDVADSKDAGGNHDVFAIRWDEKK